MKNDETDKPTTKRDSRKQAYISKIIESARDIFAEKGFRTTSVDEIAERAGVTKKTLYSYFPSKISLYSRMYDDYQNKIDQSLQKLGNLDLPSDRLVLAYLESIFQFTKKHEKFMKFHMWLLDTDEFAGDIPDELKKKVFKHSNEMQSTAAGLLARALKDGRMIDVDPHVLVECIVAINKGIYFHASSDRRYKSPGINTNKLYEMFKVILTRGLSK